MKAGWIFCKNDGANAPRLPDGVTGTYVNNLEIHRVTGGSNGFEHDHLLLGGVALPSIDRAGEADAHHSHYVVWYEGQYRQLTTGAAPHTHDLNLIDGILAPDWFLIFWRGSNADAAAIIADPQCVLAAEATVTANSEGGFDIGQLDSAVWTAQEKTTWETQIANVLALALPTDVDAPAKLVTYFVGALTSRPQQREVWLRPTHVQ